MDPTRRQFILGSPLLAGAGIHGLSAAPARAESGTTPLAPPQKQPESLDVPEAPRKQLGWAIVGLGELALGEVMPAFGQCRLAKPVALVSGHRDKAEKVAAAYGIEDDAIYNYENFDEIVKDERIDVVYIILPNSMHAEFTIRALKAGKHVLCEKPMAVTVSEAEEMIAVAETQKRKLMVAYRLHFEPLNLQAVKWCREKRFGEIRSFASSNCQDVKAPNIRLSQKLGGGPVGDVGVYSINIARAVLGEEPLEVTAHAVQPDDDPRFREVPQSVAYTLRYPSGVIANCDCSFGSAESRRYRVLGTKGWVEVDPAFSYRGLGLRLQEPGAEGEPARKSEIQISQVNHFAAEIDGCSEAILGDKESPVPASMGLADMKIMAAIDESIRTGKTIRL